MKKMTKLLGRRSRLIKKGERTGKAKEGPIDDDIKDKEAKGKIKAKNRMSDEGEEDGEDEKLDGRDVEVKPDEMEKPEGEKDEEDNKPTLKESRVIKNDDIKI